MLCPGQDEIREEKSRQTLRCWWCGWVVWDDNKNVIYAKGFWTLTCSLDLVTREFILYFFLRATELPIMVARNIMKLYLNFTLTGSYAIHFDNRCLFWLNFNFKVEKVEALLKKDSLVLLLKYRVLDDELIIKAGLEVSGFEFLYIMNIWWKLCPLSFKKCTYMQICIQFQRVSDLKSIYGPCSLSSFLDSFILLFLFSSWLVIICCRGDANELKLQV